MFKKCKVPVWCSGANANVVALPEDLLAEVFFVLSGEM